MLRQTEWRALYGIITNNRLLQVTTLLLWEYCFSLRISYKELIRCTDSPNVQLHSFRKDRSFVWVFFFFVNILSMNVFILFNSTNQEYSFIHINAVIRREVIILFTVNKFQCVFCTRSLYLETKIQI